MHLFFNSFMYSLNKRFNLSRYLLILSIFCLFAMPAMAANPFDNNIKTLAEELANELSKSQKTILAVANFIDLQGNETELGKYLAEEFSFALREANPSLKIIDRSRVNFLLKEQGLTTSGLVDPKATAKLGKLAGIEALLTGIITPRGDSIRLTVKALNLETAITLADSRGEIPRTQSLSDLFDSFIQRRGNQAARSSLSSNARTRASRARGMAITQTVELEGFRADLEQCIAENKTVTCQLTVMRTAKGDFQAEFYRSRGNGLRTRIFDAYGSESWASYLSVGQKGCDSCGDIDSRMPESIPVRVKAIFKLLDSNVDRLALLEVVFHEENKSKFYRLKFRDIQLVRQ